MEAIVEIRLGPLIPIYLKKKQSCQISYQSNLKQWYGCFNKKNNKMSSDETIIESKSNILATIECNQIVISAWQSAISITHTSLYCTQCERLNTSLYISLHTNQNWMLRHHLVFIVTVITEKMNVNLPSSVYTSQYKLLTSSGIMLHQSLWRFP